MKACWSVPTMIKVITDDADNQDDDPYDQQIRKPNKKKTLGKSRQDILISHASSSNHWSIKTKDASPRIPHTVCSHIGKWFLDRLPLHSLLSFPTSVQRHLAHEFCKRLISGISVRLICSLGQRAITCLLRDRLRSPLLRQHIQALSVRQSWVGLHELLFHEHCVHCVWPDSMEI